MSISGSTALAGKDKSAPIIIHHFRPSIWTGYEIDESAVRKGWKEIRCDYLLNEPGAVDAGKLFIQEKKAENEHDVVKRSPVYLDKAYRQSQNVKDIMLIKKWKLKGNSSGSRRGDCHTRPQKGISSTKSEFPHGNERVWNEYKRVGRQTGAPVLVFISAARLEQLAWADRRGEEGEEGGAGGAGEAPAAARRAGAARDSAARGLRIARRSGRCHSGARMSPLQHAEERREKEELFHACFSFR
ncbi:hypothetical protein LSTR_LSTR006459, partial [Laodelphax striatellus]